MKWEIPGEPKDVRCVWTPDATGDGHIKWVKLMNPGRGIEMWRDASIMGGRVGPWHTWSEVLDHGPATDEDPEPPELFWSPRLRAVYLTENPGRYRLLWFNGELPADGAPRLTLPLDARPMNMVRVPGPRVGS